MNEFELIRHFFARGAGATPDVALGIGDDCALLQPPAGEQLAITADTLVAGRHFPVDTAPEAIAWKALAVNLSDLAAMGAQPLWFLLALTLPSFDSDWLAAFATELQRLAQRYGIALVGGDTTRGPLSLTITAVGSVSPALALRRDRAQIGDLIAVTGTLGDAALGLHLRGARAGNGFDALIERLERPTPRVAEGLTLRGLANAAIDLSDGLAGDLQHILTASGVGAEVDADALPMSEAFRRLHAPARRLSLQAVGGDDYELCVTIPPAHYQQAAAQVPLTVIGRVVATPGLHWHRDGQVVPGPQHGYRHFDGSETPDAR